LISSQVKLPNLNDSASEDLERLLKDVWECEDFDLDFSTNATSQSRLVEKPILRSENAPQTFAESLASQPGDYPDDQVCWIILILAPPRRSCRNARRIIQTCRSHEIIFTS
jgi:hypothetical protein